MFTHLYLKLVTYGNKSDAQKFHKKHHKTFLGNVEFAQFIQRLNKVTTTEELYRDDVVLAYYNSRYSVTLSSKTFKYLMNYLQSQHHSTQNGNAIILLEILRTKMDLKIADALGACSKSESIQRIKNDLEHIDKESKSISFSHKVMQDTAKSRGVSAQNAKDTNMERLSQIIRAAHDNGPTPLPSTCLYKIISDGSSATTSVTISEDFSLIALGCEDSSVSVWDLLPSTSSLENQHAFPSGQLNYNAACEIPLGCDRNQLRKVSKRFETNSEANTKRKIMLGHSGPIYDVSFVPTVCHREAKTLLLSVSRDKTMRLWNVSENTNVSVYKGHTYPVWSLDIDRIGINVVTGSMDKTAKLWQLEYTYPLRMYAGHELDVDVVKFHPNCNYLATASADKTVRLWSHADAKMVRVFTGNNAGVHALGFSPNGKLIASGGEDRTVRIWDIGSSTLLKEFKGHSDIIYSLVWNQDSSLLASSGLDGTIRLWDVKSPGIKVNDGQSFVSVANGPTKVDVLGDINEHAASNSILSQELKACYPTSCSNILKLAYSPHNTLIAAGISSSSNSNPPTAISGLTSVASNVVINKSIPTLGLPVTGTINTQPHQSMSVGFTKIFVNGGTK